MEHNSKTFGQNQLKQDHPRCNDRITINGILFVLSVGCRWEEMPAQYGSKSTAHLRFSELQQKGNAIKVIVDGAYDSENNFSYLYHNTNALPAIKVRKTLSIKTKCYPRRKSVLAQIFNYELWKHSVSYGD